MTRVAVGERLYYICSMYCTLLYCTVQNSNVLYCTLSYQAVWYRLISSRIRLVLLSPRDVLSCCLTPDTAERNMRCLHHS